jgi:dienelactone hydrolase
LRKTPSPISSIDPNAWLVGTIVTAVLRETYRCAAVVLAAAGVLAGCGGSDEDSGLAKPFAYKSSVPLDFQSRATPLGGQGVEVRDISFAGPAGAQLNGYLASPSSSGKHPGVIYAHGAGGNRSELLDQAISMARRGAVGLTLDMSYSPERAAPLPSGMAGVRARAQTEVDAVREIRRSVDLLRSLSSVDGERLGYVGWSAGARVGAVAAGVDHRIQAFDLIAGGATPVSEYVDLAPEDLRPELRSVLGKTDPLRYVSHASPSALLFQDGRQDELVPQPALRLLAKTGSEPKDIRWYDSGHAPSSQAWTDSRRWLADHLGLTNS